VRRGWWRLVLGTAAFSLVVPIGFVALPLAALLVASRPAPGVVWGLALGLAGLGAWTLFPAPGDRLAALQAAFALCAAVAFAGGALLAPVGLWRQAVRALLWAVAATAALAWAAWGGIPWSELHWEATRNATVTVFSAIAFVPSAFSAMEALIRLLSDLPPVALALKTVVGLALAWHWHARLAPALLAALDRLAAPAPEARDASLSAQPGSPVVPNHT